MYIFNLILGTECDAGKCKFSSCYCCPGYSRYKPWFEDEICKSKFSHMIWSNQLLLHVKIKIIRIWGYRHTYQNKVNKIMKTKLQHKTEMDRSRK